MKQQAKARLENALGRNLMLRNFLGVMNNHFYDDPETLTEINRLLRGCITDQKNLIKMNESNGSYVVEPVVLDVWEE